MITDRRIQACGAGDVIYYKAQTVSISDYYPFGMQVKERTWSAPELRYRFGFQGQEGDNEVNGEGNSYTAEYWQYDSRLGKRWNVDPLYKKSPHISPYACFGNNPLFYTDDKGLEPEPVKGGDRKKRKYIRKERRMQNRAGGTLSQQQLDRNMQSTFGNRRWMYARGQNTAGGDGNSPKGQAENAEYRWYSIRELVAYDRAIANPTFQTITSPINGIPDNSQNFMTTLPGNCAPNCSQTFNVGYAQNTANIMNGTTSTTFRISVLSAATPANNNSVSVNNGNAVQIGNNNFVTTTNPQNGITPSISVTFNLNPNLSNVGVNLNNGITQTWTGAQINITRQVRVTTQVQQLPDVKFYELVGGKKWRTVRSGVVNKFR